MSREKEDDARAVEVINALHKDIEKKDRALDIVSKHLEAMANELQELTEEDQ
jgi:hypothetical protein